MAILDKFRSIFQIKESPHRIAMAFAVGVFWGISPFIGLHTVSALLSAWMLGLNRLVALVGVYVTNPWTIVPIYTFCLWVGAKMWGLKRVLPAVDWNNVKFIQLATEMKVLIWPFIIGTFTVATAGACASYFIIYWVAARYRRIHDAA